MSIQKVWLSTAETADYLGFHANTLRNSRHLGRLAGVKAPTYKKIGRVCRYDRADLEKWLEQFKTLTTTEKKAAKAKC